MSEPLKNRSEQQRDFNDNMDGHHKSMNEGRKKLADVKDRLAAQLEATERAKAQHIENLKAVEDAHLQDLQDVARILKEREAKPTPRERTGATVLRSPDGKIEGIEEHYE